MQSAKALTDFSGAESQDLIWKLICYSPKMPARLQQQQVLDEAEKSQIEVLDPHFEKGCLKANVFSWGTGPKKVVISHGWASKAADFTDLITQLRLFSELQIIAFDAPGNGGSEGKLSNLLLFTETIKGIISKFGSPDALIGHSLGAMANILALQQTEILPKVLISLAPIIKLQQNFEARLISAGIPDEARDQFFSNFETLFEVPASYFNLINLYNLNKNIKHIVFSDIEDSVHPHQYLTEFLEIHESVGYQNYSEVGHDKIIKSERVISDISGLLVREIGLQKSILQ